MTETILWVTALIMFVGGSLILVLSRRALETQGMISVAHGLVPIIAGCAYVAMATGQGAVLLPTDATLAGLANTTRVFWFARYIDWAVTTPLLLVSLLALGSYHGRKRADIFVGAIVADLLMIVTSFAFSASENYTVRWIWFALSCISMLGVYYAVWVSQRGVTRLETGSVQSAYLSNAAILSVLWLGYPIILALSPDGLARVNNHDTIIVIAVLDVLAKVGFGLLGLIHSRRLSTV